MSQQNLLLRLGKNSFGPSDGDGILLEDDITSVIILDGTDPLPAVNFIVQEDTGDNFIQETGTVGSDTDRILAETSIVTFTATQVQNVGEKLLQDNPTDVDTISISDMNDLRFIDIIRTSKILLEQPFAINDKEFVNKLILEQDSVTPLKLENGFLLSLEDSVVSDELYPFRSFNSGQGDIDSGFDDDDGIALEGGGFIVLDDTTGAFTDVGSRLLTEDNESILQEENGILNIEDYSPNSHIVKIELETATNGNRLSLERSLEPEIQDGVQVENGIDRIVLDGTDASSTDAGGKILFEIDESDIDALTEQFLLEESVIFFDKGQIPKENYSLSVSQDRPVGVITKGMQPVTISSVISTRT